MSVKQQLFTKNSWIIFHKLSNLFCMCLRKKNVWVLCEYLVHVQLIPRTICILSVYSTKIIKYIQTFLHKNIKQTDIIMKALYSWLVCQKSILLLYIYSQWLQCCRIKYSQTCLMSPSKWTLKYGHLKQVVIIYTFFNMKYSVKGN